ncbi:EAL domain-containing protein [Nocardiopsis sp. CNT312]|uniref:EAL domain-containing protein n=1 Tax=Nocardiopsis sp. CNT312 TaxID=1137268 RepID=UPI001E617015|nr:EAL domain-containing protein [Nocardiopsis sp. CNT312]
MHRSSRSIAHRPVVDLESGAVLAVEVVASPPPVPRSASGAVTPREQILIAEWLVNLIGQSGASGTLLPLVLPLPARMLTAGDEFVSLLDSRLRRSGRRPSDITLMLSPELSALPRQFVTSGVARLRSAGFRCGFGTALVSPDLVLETVPYLIRLDPSIVSDVASDQRRTTVVEGLARIGRGSGVYSMASGIKHGEDVVRLRRCGLRVGTGPFFAEDTWLPGERVTPVPEPTADAQDQQDSGPQITEFMLPPVGFGADVSCDEVLDAFTGDTALNSAVLIDHRDRPLGVIDRTRFLLSVTGRYGHALHAKRPALRLAEPPRTVPAWMSAIAALRVAGQDNARVYDDMIATNAYGQVVGVVHVADLIQSLSRS